MDRVAKDKEKRKIELSSERREALRKSHKKSAQTSNVPEQSAIQSGSDPTQFFTTVAKAVSITLAGVFISSVLVGFFIKDIPEVHVAYEAVAKRVEDAFTITKDKIIHRAVGGAEEVFSYTTRTASRSQAALISEYEELVFQISPLFHAISESISIKFNSTIRKVASLFGNDDKGIFVTALMPEESSELKRAREALLGTTNGTSGGLTQPSSPSGVSEGTLTAVEQPPVERVIETREVVVQAGITESYVTQLLEQLNNKLSSEIYRLSSENATQIVNNYHAISQTSKIDDLGNVTIRNSSFTDGTISGSTSFSGTSGAFSGALSAASLTVSGDSSLANFIVDATTGNVGIGTTTPYAKLSVVGPVVAEYFHATSSAATSTIDSRFLLTHAPTLPHTFSPWAIGASGSAFLDATLVVNPASSIADGNLISAAVGSSVKFLVDAEGDVFVNNLTSIGDVTLAQTTASTFSVEGNTTLGDSITDVTTINGTLTVTGQTSVSTVAGNFGVGTTTPYARLSVAGVAGGTTPLFAISTSTASNATSTALFLDANGKFGIGTSSPSNTLTVVGIADFSGNVGVGTSTPSKRLSITHTVSDAQVAIAYDDTRFAHLQVDAIGDLIISTQGGDVRLNNENLFVCSSGACPSGTPTGQGNIIVETALGIGSSSPYTTLDVAGSAAFTGTLDVQSTSATSTFGHGISIGGTGSIRFPDGTFQGTAASGADVQTFTSSGTWTKPASGTVAFVECWAGGGSGGKGTGIEDSGGGGGGGYIFSAFNISTLGATETVTIGAGGAAVTGADASGNAGGNTTFGSQLTAYGGTGGFGNNNTGAGGGGGGWNGAGSVPTATVGGNGGTNELLAAGGAGGSAADGGASTYGGGGGGGSDFKGGNSFYGGGGGGSGAGGGNGTNNAGGSSWFGGAGGGAGDSIVSGNGGTSKIGGNGGAGGTDIAGTAGAQPGGGGGGGNDAASGAGGAGQCRVIVW